MEKTMEASILKGLGSRVVYRDYIVRLEVWAPHMGP